LGKLQEKLKDLFSFTYAFPAVSGATAVENAFILALMAQKEKKRIIVFKNNYAGQTLIALIGSDMPEAHTGFGPLYAHVTYIDPYTEQAAKELIFHLSKGDVALIWFEIFQGGIDREIPENILKIVQAYKEKHGYYIGIDEIFAGFYRIDKLTSYQDTPIQPDIVTFSKAFCDGTFPIAATLVSPEVYTRACQRDAARVLFLQNLYKNQFGAHGALHCIEQLTDPSLVEQIKRTSRIFANGLKEISEKSPYLHKIEGKGHSYALIYKDRVYEIYFCQKALKKRDLFIFINRLEPALTIADEEAREIVARLKNLLQKNRIATFIDSWFYKRKLMKAWKL